MTIQEKLAILREKMKENNMDIYMIPTADFHQSFRFAPGIDPGRISGDKRF